MRERRVLLVGAGTRARKVYLPWLAEARAVVDGRQPVAAVAVLDQDEDAARTAVTDSGLTTMTAGPAALSDLLVRGEVDCVVVTTPDDTHVGLVGQALAHGVDVLVEKPLATTVADVEEILEAEQRSAGRVMVTHNLRFAGLHLKVRDLIASGSLGRVLRVTFDYSLNPDHGHSYFVRWHRQRKASGGLEITKASHHFDLLSWWLGARVVAVTGILQRNFFQPGHPSEHVVGRPVPPDADLHDTITALLEYDSGATAHYSLTAAAPSEGYTCTVRGTKGVCEFSCWTRGMDGQTVGGPFVIRLRTLDTDTGRVSTLRVPRETGSHAGADARMIACLSRPGYAGAFATAREAGEAVAVGEALRLSAAQGERRLVPPLLGTAPHTHHGPEESRS
ncbi:Gfo/Idh/MocA family protein [Streptomyces radiopugnans]|uniref:Gfo/Idh/MocA family protein n=1 Tax=Streptomyces radiopugnans TaxID=403935 RepID=UPI003F1BEBD3